MSNPWIDHVKKYAKQHNISYACAISHTDCKNSYTKITKEYKKQQEEYKQQQEEKQIEIIRKQSANLLAQRINNDKDKSQYPFIRLKLNSKSEEFKNYFKTHYPKEYAKLMKSATK